MELKHDEVTEVRTVQTDEEANELLKKGWVLLASGCRHLGQTGLQAKTYFTLAKMGGMQKKHS